MCFVAMKYRLIYIYFILEKSIFKYNKRFYVSIPFNFIVDEYTF